MMQERGISHTSVYSCPYHSRVKSIDSLLDLLIERIRWSRCRGAKAKRPLLLLLLLQRRPEARKKKGGRPTCVETAAKKAAGTPSLMMMFGTHCSYALCGIG